MYSVYLYTNSIHTRYVGTFFPNVSASSCLSCPTGYYSVGDQSGTVRCTWCGNGAYISNSHWIGGGTSKSQCLCATGYTGNNCEIQGCKNVLLGGSLVSILFTADQQLRQYTASYASMSVDQLISAKNYLTNLLSVLVDVNGDGAIARNEMTTALRFRSIQSPNMSSLNLWCKKASADDCYYKTPNLIPVSNIIQDAWTNFNKNNSKHTFDGSGISFVNSMSSTFPNASWSDDQCKVYDSVQNPLTYQHVKTAWQLTTTHPSISRVCGYSNGILNGNFKTTSILNGTQTNFVDISMVTASNLYKRVYCISIDYNAFQATAYECSVGLFYVSEGCSVDSK